MKGVLAKAFAWWWQFGMGPEEERILWVFENSGSVEGVNSTLYPGFSDVVFHHPLLSGMLAHGKEVCLA